MSDLLRDRCAAVQTAYVHRHRHRDPPVGGLLDPMELDAPLGPRPHDVVEVAADPVVSDECHALDGSERREELDVRVALGNGTLRVAPRDGGGEAVDSVLGGSCHTPSMQAIICSVAALDDVAGIALSLPATSEAISRGLRQWKVKDRLFVWERPLRRSDLEALGDAVPDGPILGARVEHEGAKQALIADDPGVFFTTPHFDGYPAILVRLDRIKPTDLHEVIVEAWLCRAPKRAAAEWAAGQDP